MEKSIVLTHEAPTPIGPYSQATALGPWVFCSGQIPLPDKLQAPVAEQAELVLQNLTAVLRKAGCSLNDVLKVTIYLIDMNDFQAVNEVYAKHFANNPPARSTIAVAALPKGARVEIEATAFCSKF